MVDHAEDRAAPDDEGQAGDAQGAPAGERVAKALARAGVASRRDVERYIAAGRVALNGRVLDTPAVKVEPGDVLTVDGAVVGGPEATRVWRHHKPAGLITSHGDPAGRPTVFEHLPPGLPRVISIGRLDLATEGLLLLTNDGELARRLELPDNGWRRVYRARAHGRADQARLDTLKAGVTIEGVRYGPVEARLDKATGQGAVGRGRVSDAPANLWITVTVAEGKNREVRRVLEHLGLKVNRLIRLAYGPFALGELLPGEVQEVGPRVLREQLADLVPAASLPQGDRRPGPPVRGASPSNAAPPRTSGATEQGRAARPRGLQPSRSGPAHAPPTGRGRGGGEKAHSGKPAARPAGAVGRVSGAWSPPGQRSAAAGPPGAKPPRGRPNAAPAKPARAGGPSDRGAPTGNRGPNAGRGPGSVNRLREETGPARAPRAEGRPAQAERTDGPRGPRSPSGPPRGRGGPGGPKGAGGKASARPSAAGARDADRATGLELATPMRRGPRRKPGTEGPRRPPRKD